MKTTASRNRKLFPFEGTFFQFKGNYFNFVLSGETKFLPPCLILLLLIENGKAAVHNYRASETEKETANEIFTTSDLIMRIIKEGISSKSKQR